MNEGSGTLFPCYSYNCRPFAQGRSQLCNRDVELSQIVSSDACNMLNGITSAFGMSKETASKEPKVGAMSVAQAASYIRSMDVKDVVHVHDDYDDEDDDNDDVEEEEEEEEEE
ncbi:hypothetical protein AK812_SmicGene11468 [Symbiodinium microadriaticum]|uniref:Uncharacterized protein n=1 Tax=Symbiodinium microadriaticum TaxID=2951 RepID=A0A1Q9EDA2_SYMMI|nr:hypothetical protein AK812_SmicGene11468 [Symbiodinium microadriaticum]